MTGLEPRQDLTCAWSCVGPAGDAIIVVAGDECEQTQLSAA